MNDPRIARLQRQFFSQGELDAGSLSALAAALEDRRFPAGSSIFREGDEAPEMYFVVTGKVGIFKRSGDARVPLAELGPGSYFGELALVDEGARSADAEALEDVELLALRAQAFDELLDHAPRLALFFLRATSKRLRQASEQAARPGDDAGLAPDPVRERFPFPIASVYGSMVVMADARPRLERLFDLLEVTVRFVGTVAVAQYVAADARHPRVDHLLERGLGSNTLGRYVGLVRDAIAPGVEGAATLFVPELRERFLGTSGQAQATLDGLWDLVSFRNQQRHGAGGALTEEAAAKVLAAREPQLLDVLERLSFLADYPLVWLERMDFSRGRFVYRFQRCMGSHADFATQTVALGAPYDTGHLYLLDREGSALLPLFPWLLLDTCQVCAHRDLFFLSTSTPSAATYCEFRRGHHLGTEAPLEALADLRARAKARAAASPPLRELGLEDLLALVGGKDARRRAGALRELGGRGDRRVTPALLGVLEAALARGDRTFAGDVLAALGKLRDGRALGALERAVAEPALARPAVRALGRLGRKEAAPALWGALARPELRALAVRSLVALGSPGKRSGVVAGFDAERGEWNVSDGRGGAHAFVQGELDAPGEPHAGQRVTFFAFEEGGRKRAAHVRPAVETVAAGQGPAVAGEGLVRWFDPQKGIGFVRDDATGEDVMVRASDVRPPEGDAAAGAMPPTLRAKQRVRYLRARTARGWRAREVVAVAAPANTPA